MLLRSCFKDELFISSISDKRYTLKQILPFASSEFASNFEIMPEFVQLLRNESSAKELEMLIQKETDNSLTCRISEDMVH